jgi:hypothetical protein
MVDLPFLAQEDLDACVPACLRMILAAYTIERSELEKAVLPNNSQRLLAKRSSNLSALI